MTINDQQIPIFDEKRACQIKESRLKIFDDPNITPDVWFVPFLQVKTKLDCNSAILMAESDKLVAFRASY